MYAILDIISTGGRRRLRSRGASRCRSPAPQRPAKAARACPRWVVAPGARGGSRPTDARSAGTGLGLRTPVTALLNANVLYSAPVRDLFMQLAVSDVFRARWTADIHREMMNSSQQWQTPRVGRPASRSRPSGRERHDRSPAQVSTTADRAPRILLQWLAVRAILPDLGAGNLMRQRISWRS